MEPAFHCYAAARHLHGPLNLNYICSCGDARARPDSRSASELGSVGSIRRHRDGTADVVLEPLDFIARLATLVPKTPRGNLTCYHGPFPIVYWSMLPWINGYGETTALQLSAQPICSDAGGTLILQP